MAGAILTAPLHTPRTAPGTSPPALRAPLYLFILFSSPALALRFLFISHTLSSERYCWDVIFHGARYCFILILLRKFPEPQENDLVVNSPENMLLLLPDRCAICTVNLRWGLFKSFLHKMCNISFCVLLRYLNSDCFSSSAHTDA